MPSLKAIETSEAEPKAKALLEGVQKKLGMTPNLMRTMANSPPVLEAYLGLGNALGKGHFVTQTARTNRTDGRRTERVSVLSLRALCVGQDGGTR